MREFETREARTKEELEGRVRNLREEISKKDSLTKDRDASLKRELDKRTQLEGTITALSNRNEEVMKELR